MGGAAHLTLRQLNQRVNLYRFLVSRFSRENCTVVLVSLPFPSPFRSFFPFFLAPSPRFPSPPAPPRSPFLVLPLNFLPHSLPLLLPLFPFSLLLPLACPLFFLTLAFASLSPLLPLTSPSSNTCSLFPPPTSAVLSLPPSFYSLPFTALPPLHIPFPSLPLPLQYNPPPDSMPCLSPACIKPLTSSPHPFSLPFYPF